MVYSSKDFNYVDFCRDSAKHASMMAFAAPKIESLWSDESLHYSHPLSRDSKSMEKDQLISMIHFLEERGKESERDNKELKELVKELRDIHKQDMRIKLDLMESVDKLTNQVAELSEQNKVLEQEVDNLLP